MTGKRQSFSKEFKRDAVKMVHVDGRGVTEAAEELGINRSTLQNWVNAAEPAEEPKPRKEEAAQKFVRRRIHAWQRRDK